MMNQDSEKQDSGKKKGASGKCHSRQTTYIYMYNMMDGI